jgi:hypothetical protein
MWLILLIIIIFGFAILFLPDIFRKSKKEQNLSETSKLKLSEVSSDNTQEIDLEDSSADEQDNGMNESLEPALGFLNDMKYAIENQDLMGVINRQSSTELKKEGKLRSFEDLIEEFCQVCTIVHCESLANDFEAYLAVYPSDFQAGYYYSCLTQFFDVNGTIKFCINQLKKFEQLKQTSLKQIKDAFSLARKAYQLSVMNNKSDSTMIFKEYFQPRVLEILDIFENNAETIRREEYLFQQIMGIVQESACLAYINSETLRGLDMSSRFYEIQLIKGDTKEIQMKFLREEGANEVNFLRRLQNDNIYETLMYYLRQSN